MSFLWVGLGTAALTAGTSIYGASQQKKGAERAQDINLEMFRQLNAQQQPFMQSGYGAMGRLNTLLGLNPNPRAQRMPTQFTPGQSFMPTPGGGVQPIMQTGQRSIVVPPDRSGGTAYRITPGGGVEPVLQLGQQAPGSQPDVRLPADPRREQVAMLRDLLRARGMGMR